MATTLKSCYTVSSTHSLIGLHISGTIETDKRHPVGRLRLDVETAFTSSVQLVYVGRHPTWWICALLPGTHPPTLVWKRRINGHQLTHSLSRPSGVIASQLLAHVALFYFGCFRRHLFKELFLAFRLFPSLSLLYSYFFSNSFA